MNDSISIEEFSNQLGDLVWSALLNRLPAFNVATVLFRATCAISAAADINVADLIIDLNDFIAGMNSDRREHLH